MAARSQVFGPPTTSDIFLAQVTASFGMAGGEDVGADSVETLYKFADTACYQAKEAGRNRVCVYEPTLVEGGQEFTRVAPS